MEDKLNHFNAFMIQNIKNRKLLFLLMVLTCFFIRIKGIRAQNELTGRWSGKIAMINVSLQFELEISKPDASYQAKLSIPQQGLKDFQLPLFRYKKPKVHFELTGAAGTAKFDGILSKDSIRGTLIQAGIKGSFFMGRSPAVRTGTKPDVLKSEPLPYSEEEIAFKSGRILLSGTLTSPKKDGKFPALVLLTGIGPQNRDEEIYGFKIFEIIADYLTRRDLIVLRYDDRGVGGSSGNSMTSTTEDFAGDALAAVDFLKKQNNVDVNKIGLLGHSEGGIIAPLAASNSGDVAFIILVSGFGVTGSDLLIEQQRRILKANSVPDSIIEQNLILQKKINETLSADKDLNGIIDEIRSFAEKDFKNLSPDVKKAILDKKSYIESNVRSQIMMFNNPWFKFFVGYNPLPALRKVKIPVLMTFGGLDLQAPADQNKPLMEEALRSAGNRNFKSILFPNANHLYQAANTGSPGEYPELSKSFVDGFLETIGDWISGLWK
jgi:uncharacterized protein